MIGLDIGGRMFQSTARTIGAPDRRMVLVVTLILALAGIAQRDGTATGSAQTVVRGSDVV